MPRRKRDLVRVDFFVPRHLKAALTWRAKKRHTTDTQILVEALEQFLAFELNAMTVLAEEIRLQAP